MLRLPSSLLFLALVLSVAIHVVLLMMWRRSESSSSAGVSAASMTPPASANLRGRIDEDAYIAHPKSTVKAAIVILIRNSEIDGLEKTLPMYERRFNQHYNYPYVFLNDADFTDEFKERARKLSKSRMIFGKVPKEHWSYPSWIDQEHAAQCRKDMESRNIIYGGSESYRHMCRYNSGFFFRHPLLLEFDYYWRIEPYVEFFCDVQYDPFEFMQKNNKDYGFVIMIPEYVETVPTLWKTTKEFMDKNKDLIPSNNSLHMFTDGKDGYNMCHFWSNFEIGNLNFFRSEKYLKYFDFLDKQGGFFYERWGDAPVHSLGLAMFLPKERLHFFEDIGYLHNPYRNCPANPALQKHCDCDPKESVNLNNDCFNRYIQLTLQK